MTLDALVLKLCCKATKGVASQLLVYLLECQSLGKACLHCSSSSPASRYCRASRAATDGALAGHDSSGSWISMNFHPS
jgi:hypothetical protein